MSGITRNTPNPPGGEVVKDEKGEPNGILRNAAQLLKGAHRAETFTEQEKLTALQQMLQRYVEAGLTSVEDRAVGPSDVALYERLHADKRLPVRVGLTWRIDASRSYRADRAGDHGVEVDHRSWRRLASFRNLQGDA